MTFGLEHARAPRPERLWFWRFAPWGALVLSLSECRSPPPVPRTAADPPAAQALVPDSELRDPPEREPEAGTQEAPHGSRAAPANDAREQRELAERYGRRRSQGVLKGEASYYGGSFAGRKTASGEVFEPQRYTAAHRTLPFGTVLRVTRTDTHAIVYVRVNDRGPYGKKGRILDLSTAAAAELGMLRRGVADVRADIVERGVAPAKKAHGHGH